MSKKKAAPFIGAQREKLIIALSAQDLVGGINLAMRVRKMTFTLNYSTDHFARLFVALYDGKPEQFMLLDQRKHCCYITSPRNRELLVAMQDITNRLHNFGGRLSLTGDKPRTGPKRAMLQVYVDGAEKIALTLMSTTKGKTVSDTSFQLPDGTTP